jgi:hypothetical protein
MHTTKQTALLHKDFFLPPRALEGGIKNVLPMFSMVFLVPTILKASLFKHQVLNGGNRKVPPKWAIAVEN